MAATVFYFLFYGQTVSVMPVLSFFFVARPFGFLFLFLSVYRFFDVLDCLFLE
ncbi:hypothetical protein BC829DRAFT_409594 [Chytridium lagenaria]|nr:hypothetical protein BC829DRAFT_409594 [Chytridium lagenaria]